MNKLYVLVIFLVLALCILSPVSADDLDSGGIDSLMQSTKVFENPGVGVKQITDEDFQKTVDQIKAKQNRKKDKKIQKQGSTFNNDQDSEHIKETAVKNLLLLIPVELKNGDGTDIPIGHYKIVGEREGDNAYLNFYQSYTLVAKVPAIITDSDFDEQDITFVKLIPYNDERIKIIYGSMDFNAYTFIKINNKISNTN